MAKTDLAVLVGSGTEINPAGLTVSGSRMGQTAMFRNQYIAVSNSTKSQFMGMGAVDFNGLRIHTHPTLNVSIAKRPSIEIMLLGYVIDPLHPQKTNEDVVDALADTCGTSEKLFQEIQGLSGRYVLLYKNDSCFLVTGDACHLRQIYFGFIEGGIVLTSSPKLFLTYFNHDLQISREKEEFIRLPAYADHESAWYGDQCIDDRLQKLLPNHYLEIVRKEVRRIPRVPGHEWTNEERIIDYASTLLKGTYSALSQRYRLMQPITAGWDSRILLAAGKDIKDCVQFYVFAWSSEEAADVWVPKNLSRRLGVAFTVIKPVPLREEFLSRYRQEHILPRVLPKTAQIQYHDDRGLDGAVINVNGNVAEIARCFYGYTRRDASMAMLLMFSGYGKESRFVEGELEKWYPQACQYATDLGIPLLDLFYWEQRMGNWGALFPFEQDMAVEEISPFNNRSLLHSLLSVSPERRRAPHYLFFRKLAQRLWPEALAEKVNPDARYVAELVKGNSMMRYFVLTSRRKAKTVRSTLTLRTLRGTNRHSDSLRAAPNSSCA